MESMAPYDDTGFGNGAAFYSAVFKLQGVDHFVVSVSAWTAGTATFQYAHTQAEVLAGTWLTLDATELVFTAVGAKTVLFGECFVRCLGDSSADFGTIYIGGDNVYPLTTEERTAMGLG
jgi:hypothetical protein